MKQIKGLESRGERYEEHWTVTEIISDKWELRLQGRELGRRGILEEEMKLVEGITNARVLKLELGFFFSHPLSYFCEQGTEKYFWFLLKIVPYYRHFLPFDNPSAILRGGWQLWSEIRRSDKVTTVLGRLC